MLKSAAGSRKRKLDPFPPATSRSLSRSRSRSVSSDESANRDGMVLRSGMRLAVNRDGMVLRSGMRLAVPVPAPGGGTQTQRENLPDFESGELAPDPDEDDEAEPSLDLDALLDSKPKYKGNDPDLIRRNSDLYYAWSMKLIAKYSEPLDALPPEPPFYMGDDRKRKARSKLNRRIWLIQKQAWLKQQQKKMLEKMLEKCSGKVEDLSIKPPGGLTERELNLISPYLMKKPFELDDGPTPAEHVDFKAFLDQVRISPYNVKVPFQASPYVSGFVPVDEAKLKASPWINKHLKAAIRLVIRALRKERDQLYKREGLFNNFIQIKWHYLLSQDVRDASGTLQTVGSLFGLDAGKAPQTVGVEA